MADDAPKTCPYCGVSDTVQETGRFYRCSDCGRAWPKPEPTPKPTGKGKSK